MQSIPTMNAFLACSTPVEWLTFAVEHQDTLLVDHANCEKKAAAAALHLMHRYFQYDTLLAKMARLAREELLHFQKVFQLMQRRGIVYHHLSPGSYAGQLRKQVRTYEPEHLVDLLIIGAVIEARSCERFHASVPYLDAELGAFYQSLYKAEQRHYEDYLRLAEQVSPESIQERVPFFTELEAKLITSSDDLFRFHSGIPVLSDKLIAI